jgi:hypothetical protein
MIWEMSALAALFRLVHPVLINISLVVLDELQNQSHLADISKLTNRGLVVLEVRKHYAIKPEMEIIAGGGKHFNL